MSDKNNYMLVSLDDDKSKDIAEIVSSKTCRKIMNCLAEKEASQKDLSDALGIALNTVEYNIKKLLSSGFIEKTKNFFWSKKGKKIIMYKLSNKSIIISPKKSALEKIKSILPAFILIITGTIVIGVYEKITSSYQRIQKNIPLENDVVFEIEQSVAKASSFVSGDFLNASQGTPLWAFFLLGALIAIAIISIVNWRKL